uniref:Endonuclease domain-containing 1 protein-like n=1 Tax=Cyprinus carpio TaxID=7962 RepID=A0A8C1QYL6_CYPCA
MKMCLLVISVLLVLGFPFIMTAVVDSFTACNSFFFKEQPPEIEGVLENSTSQDNNRYKLICQKYESDYRFATLYDRRAKIPLFSAYKYTGLYEGRPHIPWMIEPQLEPLDGTMSKPGVYQALQGDYWNQKKLECGHLFPRSHAPDETTAESTFTLTNTVPQKITFNNGSWRLMEQEVRKYLNSNCHDQNNIDNILAYVLTGAVPSKEQLLNKRVNIPSHMWTVFCCYNGNSKEWVSQAHWAPNKDEKNPNPIAAKTLRELEEFLWDKYGQTSLFSESCFNFERRSD